MDIFAATSAFLDPPARRLGRISVLHRIRRRSLSVLAAFGVALCAVAQASPPEQPNASITVVNGDFSDLGNNGSIGGGALGGSGGGAIGSGPWAGNYAGIAALLAPPTLTIGSGKAQISGLAGVNAGGILNNNGRFRLATGIVWQPNRRYTLEADINAGSVLAASVLTSGNAGVALATGQSKASRVASSTAGTATLVALGGTNYRLKLEYLTGASVSGNIFIQLFGEPNSLLGVNLLSAVSFVNVTLNTYLQTQTPTSIAPNGAGPYVGTVGGTVSPDISLVVLDALGDPIPGAVVTFSVPATGASAVVSPNPATTGLNGVAVVTTTANTIAGDYIITATVSGVGTPLEFPMTNLAGAPAQVGTVSGGGQSAAAGEAFSAPVTLQVLDEYGNPVSGAEVTFIPPSTGASSTFSPNPAITDANGEVSVAATANTVAGTYDVEVSVSGISPSTTFELTNQAGPAASVGSVAGSGQGAVTNTPFASPLSLQVLDQYGNPVPSVLVTFTPPASGASAVVSPATVMSGADGVVSTTATANGIPGDYSIDVSVAGIGSVAQIALTNLLDPSITVGDVGESNQNASINEPFSCLLLVQIVDGSGNPIEGLAVDFVAPATGASAVLSDNSSSGTSIEVQTDVDGLAWVEATANGIEGSYMVTAQLKYSLAAAEVFHLTNLAANDPIFGNGFDGACIPFAPALEISADSAQ